MIKIAVKGQPCWRKHHGVSRWHAGFNSICLIDGQKRYAILSEEGVAARWAKTMGKPHGLCGWSSHDQCMKHIVVERACSEDAEGLQHEGGNQRDSNLAS